MVRNYHVAGVVTDGKLKVLFSEDETGLLEALMAIEGGTKIPPQTTESCDQIQALAREWQQKHSCSSPEFQEIGAVHVPISGRLERTAMPTAAAATAA